MNIAIVVTFNKLQLLKGCLKAILNQTAKIDKVVVVDNNSRQDTVDYLKNIADDRVDVTYLKHNIGGAGGFNIGMKRAMSFNPELLWIMDDDTEPYPTAFEEILKAKANVNTPFGFIGSNVRWIDGSACVMNVPAVSEVWNDLTSQHLVQARCCSFVSVCVSAAAVKQVGYPVADFFIWGDDVEYTTRLSRTYKNYIALDSLATHLMAENKGVDILHEAPNRIPRYYFDVRNKFYIAKRNGFTATIKYLVKTFVLLMQVIFTSNFKWIKVRTILKGFFAGVIFNPVVEYYSRGSDNDTK